MKKLLILTLIFGLVGWFGCLIKADVSIALPGIVIYMAWAVFTIGKVNKDDGPSW